MPRIGSNPQKGKPTLSSYKRHRVIVPVYIPSARGYYKDSFPVFETCLQTLIATVDEDLVSITVIDNASSARVGSLCRSYVAKGKIDQYIDNAVNRGKPDAIVAAARAAYEDFVTISDADVLFEHGWLTDVENIFREFPEAGVVAPVPLPRLRYYKSSSTWLFGLTHRLLRLRGISNAEELKEHEKSFGRPVQEESADYRLQYYLERNGIQALIGAPHWVCTWRREIFSAIDYTPTQIGLGAGGLGERQIDTWADRHGALRLGGVHPRVRHLGNHLDDSARLRAAKIASTPPVKLSPEPIPQLSPGRIRRIIASRRWTKKFIVVAAETYLRRRARKGSVDVT